MKNIKSKKFISVMLSFIMMVSPCLFSTMFANAESLQAEEKLSNVAPTDWMSGILDNTYLSEITIPGTHDSCARKFSNSIVTSVSKCQDVNIATQLSYGIRFLDMRLECSDDLSLKTVHGSTDCWDGNDYYYFDFALQDVYEFLDAHPSETVVMSVKEDDGDMTTSFTQAVYNYIHNYDSKYDYGTNYDYKNCWYLSTSMPKLSDVRGKIVLVNRFDQYIGNEVSAGSLTNISESESGIKVKWGDQGGSTVVDPAYVTGQNANSPVVWHVQDRYQYSVSDKWNNAIIPMFNVGHYHGELYVNFCSTATSNAIPNPESYANSINGYLSSYALTNDKPLGVVNIDFANADLAKKIYLANQSVSTISYGTDGKISWELNRITGVLTIFGSGAMNDYEYSSTVGSSGSGSTSPWGDADKNSLYTYNTDFVKSIVINNGVTTIGNYAFYGFDNVESVSIASSVTSIGNYAFYGNKCLENVDVSQTYVAQIGENAFNGCTSLKKMYVNNDIISIGNNAFASCSSLTMYGQSGTYSYLYANTNNIPYIATGAYDEDTDWFTSKANYYDDFATGVNGTINNGTSDNGYSVSYQDNFAQRDGIIYFPYSGTGSSNTNYISTQKNPFKDCDTSKGVTFSYYQYINGGVYGDRFAISFAQGDIEENKYFCIGSNGCIRYNMGNGGTDSNYSSAGLYFDYTGALSNISSKTWQYVTVQILDDWTIKYFVDGILSSTISISNANGANENYMKSGGLLEFLRDGNTSLYYGSYNPYWGTPTLVLDEFSAYDFALSDDEIKGMAYSYQTPVLVDSTANYANDSNINIVSSNGYKNVLYTHGKNTLTQTGVSQAADYMFVGDEIANGDNDEAYVYSTSAAGQENELFTSFTINSKYTVDSITDNYGNALAVSNSKIDGKLSLGYSDGSSDDLTLTIKYHDSNNTFSENVYVHVEPHPVSAHAVAASVGYNTSWTGTKSNYRDVGILLRANGSTGESSAYWGGNYSYISTPAFIGNGWNFASSTNADAFLMLGDGYIGKTNSLGGLNNTSGLDITSAGTYSQNNGAANSDSMTAVGTSANYYVDKSQSTANTTIGGVTVGADGNSFSIPTFITRVSPLYSGTNYYWTSTSGISTSNSMTWDYSNGTTIESIETSGTVNTEQANSFNFNQVDLKGNLNNASIQNATLTAGVYHGDTSSCTATSVVDVKINVYDKSVLRNLVNTCENAHFTGEGTSVANWNMFNTALKVAYANLNDYTDTTVVSTTDEIYVNLKKAFDSLTADNTKLIYSANIAVQTLDNGDVYVKDSISNIVQSINSFDLSVNSSVGCQELVDIANAKIIFSLRFIKTIESETGIAKINSSVSEKTDTSKWDINLIEECVNNFYNEMKTQCLIGNDSYTFNCYYNQGAYDALVDNTLFAIEQCDITPIYLQFYYDGQIDESESSILSNYILYNEYTVNTPNVLIKNGTRYNIEDNSNHVNNLTPGMTISVFYNSNENSPSDYLLCDYEFSNNLDDSIKGNESLTIFANGSSSNTGVQTYESVSNTNSAINLNAKNHLKIPQSTTNKIISSAKDGITVVARVKKTMLNNQFLFTMCSDYQSGNANSFGIIDAYNLRFEMNRDSSTTNINRVTTELRTDVDETYSDIAVVYNSMGDINIFIDGKLVGTGKSTYTMNEIIESSTADTFSAFIGGSSWLDTDYCGLIDNFKVYGAALTNDEVKVISKGYLVSGNVVAFENENSYPNNYGVQNAVVKIGDLSAITDENGYFEIYAKEGTYTLTVDYNYGIASSQSITVDGNVSTKIPIIACDFNSDGHLNARDLKEFSKNNVGSAYLDLNKDGSVDKKDLEIFARFLNK